jgi:hypothetical protein
MHDDRSFRRMAGVVAIASLPLAVGNLLAMLGVVNFNLNGISEPIVLLHAGAGAAGLWRWSMILDIAGYYLPIVPLLFLLRNLLRPQSPNWVDLSTACLLAYCFVGAIGGAILATALPTLISDYASATAAHQANLATVFTGYTDAIYRGLWNLLEEFLAGVGWIGIGLALRSGQRRLGLVTLTLGAACLLDSLGTALNIDAISTVGLVIYLVLAPLWACWLGVALLRNSPAFTRRSGVHPENEHSTDRVPAGSASVG